MRDSNFGRHFDIDEMLHDMAMWLVVQAVKPTDEFVELAVQVNIRQEDWDAFWKEMREKEGRKKEIHHHIVSGKCVRCGKSFEESFCEDCKRKEGDMEVIIGDKEYRLTKEEFEVVKQILKENSPEKISDCCGADVTGCNDYTARCRDCKEICGIVYIF